MSVKFYGQVPGIIGGLLLISAVCGIAYLLSPVFDRSLTRGLEEEKSYFNHGGTNYQLRPELRGQKWNLETWDDAEEIVSAVHANNAPGVWANWSDQVSFLPRRLQLDRNGRQMCVIRLEGSVYVVRGVKKRVAQCTPIRPGFGVDNVLSGELAPSSDGIAEIYSEQTNN